MINKYDFDLKGTNGMRRVVDLYTVDAFKIERAVSVLAIDETFSNYSRQRFDR